MSKLEEAVELLTMEF